MKAEIAVMTAENIDRKAIARGGEILKNGGYTALEEMPWIRKHR